MAKILVVDDETSIREFLEILLLRAGHQVRLAKDAIDAITLLMDDTFELNLTSVLPPSASLPAAWYEPDVVFKIE